MDESPDESVAGAPVLDEGEEQLSELELANMSETNLEASLKGLPTDPEERAELAAVYDGQSPISSGCANTAITARSSSISTQSQLGHVVGRIDLRYSRSCRTVWARILARERPSGWAGVERQRDGALQECWSLSWSDSLGAWSCFTPMLNDAGELGRAGGYSWSSEGDFAVGETGWY
jgi:hypothetical protein